MKKLTLINVETNLNPDLSNSTVHTWMVKAGAKKPEMDQTQCPALGISRSSAEAKTSARAGFHHGSSFSRRSAWGGGGTFDVGGSIEGQGSATAWVPGKLCMELGYIRVDSWGSHMHKKRAGSRRRQVEELGCKEASADSLGSWGALQSSPECGQEAGPLHSRSLVIGCGLPPGGG